MHKSTLPTCIRERNYNTGNRMLPKPCTLERKSP